MRHTPQRVADALPASVAALPSRRIAEAQAALATARPRAEAVVEIDPAARSARVRIAAAGSGPPGDRRGRRWRCKGCRRTWTGRTGTPFAHVPRARPGRCIEPVRDRPGRADESLSCRKLGERLDPSRDTG